MRWRTSTAILLGVVLLFARLTLAQAPDPGVAALQKARDDLAAAERALAEAVAQKAATVQEARARVETARQTLKAENAWAARQAVTKAEAARTAADQALAAKATAASAEQGKAAAAKKAAEKAATDKAAAEKALATAPEGKKAEAKKALDEKTAAARKTAEVATQTQKAADQAARDRTAAEKARAEASTSLTQVVDAAALAHAEALGGLKPISFAQWDYARARHLLFRAGFGGPPEEVERLVQMGPHKAVDFLVEYHSLPVANNEIDITTGERPLAYENRLHVQARDRLDERRQNRDLTQRTAIRRWWLKRMVESPRPLEEKLVLFWHDHFATSWLEVRDAFLMYQQNQLFRRYADKYDGLLHGIVQDPAMIRYLNNNENVKGNNNENLGREVLELFSIGEENSAAHKRNGYTEKDVRDGNTRALTGSTYDKWTGQFRYYPDRHDHGPKTLLGKTGNLGAHDAVDIILQHPATARYVAKKLWQYFAYREPEPEVVDRLAHVLRENNYDVRPLLKNLFLSEQFYSDRSRANQIKSPVELMVGTVKVLKLTNLNYQTFDVACMNMGQTLLEPPSVAGWLEGRDWINANRILMRYNSATGLAQQGNVDLVALLQGRTLNTPAEVVDHLVQRCLLASLPETKRQALIKFLDSLPPSSEWTKQRDPVNAKLRTLVLMLMSTPEYQVN